MYEPPTISPEEPANKGVDYSYLKEEGLKLVQQLASGIWTDYNEHDPGVTTLEQLCYALTELSYRAEFPLRDLLTERRSGKLNPRRQALFIPRRILPCNPLTEDDYRRLIVDRVPQVANIWLKPHRAPDGPNSVNGLYDIWLYAPGADPCACNPKLKPGVLRRRVRRVYCRHRNLCEDVRSIRLLKEVRTVVRADVFTDGTRTPEATLAALFFNLGNFLAPELRRQPLNELIARGATPDEIFNGPLLRNGFISDEQLQPKATAIAVQDVVRVMARTAGVDSVARVTVRAGDGPPYSGSASIPVPQQEILRLDTRPDAVGNFTLRLWHNGVESQPDPARVRRELDKLWADQRRTYRLLPQYQLFFAVPQGEYRDVRRYYSIQNQYPAVYGINSFGLPSDATPARRGQAKQFKGYLLVFEQLLADFFAQLAHVKDLYSIERDLRHTYFHQSLAGSVPNVEPLLKDDYLNGLRRIVEGQDPFVERRNRFLDFLLALYAEKLSDAAAATGTGGSPSVTDERLLRAKLALLHRLVASTHDRGRGFDYLARPSPRNIAGMEIKCRIELDMEVTEGGPPFDITADGLARDTAAPVADSPVGQVLDIDADYIEEHFAPAASFPSESLGSEPELWNYRVGTLPGENVCSLVFKPPTEGDWRLLGRHADVGGALAAAAAHVELSLAAYQRARRLYIVEHTLLRFALEEPLISPPAPPFVYDFTLTAVVSGDDDRLSNQEYRTLVREVIRANAPSHLVVDYCFLAPAQLSRFEALYRAWRRALRERQRRPIVVASTRLRDFLQACARGT